MGLFSKLTPAEAGRLDGALFGGMEGQNDEIWDETAEVLGQLRDEQPQMPPESTGFRLWGR